jgi:hypothetical protein
VKEELVNGDDHGVLMDGAAGRLVPPWVRTGGRTKATHQLDLLTRVVATGAPLGDEADDNHLEVLVLCREMISIAEVAAHLREPSTAKKVPASIVKVLVSDLINYEAVQAFPPEDYSHGLSRATLEAILTGLQKRL